MPGAYGAPDKAAPWRTMAIDPRASAGAGQGLIVHGSPGQGSWAAVPWISVFDPTVTTSATRGYWFIYFTPSKPRSVDAQA